MLDWETYRNSNGGLFQLHISLADKTKLAFVPCPKIGVIRPLNKDETCRDGSIPFVVIKSLFIS